MHITEGVLSAPVLIGGAALTAVGTAIGLKKLNYDRIMNVSIMTSTFFVASLIHIPLPGAGSVHLVLNGLMGIILGYACFPAILVALFLQAVIFHFGGIVVLGTNTFILATPSLLCFLLFRPWLKRSGVKEKIASFSCGFFAVLASSIFMALALVLSNQGLLKTSLLVVGSHIPMMLIEGFITMFAISFLTKVQPDFLHID